jgi:hypothetical protein
MHNLLGIGDQLARMHRPTELMIGKADIGSGRFRYRDLGVIDLPVCGFSEVFRGLSGGARLLSCVRVGR